MTGTVLITGASGGLGGEFAELFAARSVDKLESLKKDIEVKRQVRVTVLPAALSVHFSRTLSIAWRWIVRQSNGNLCVSQARTSAAKHCHLPTGP